MARINIRSPYFVSSNYHIDAHYAVLELSIQENGGTPEAPVYTLRSECIDNVSTFELSELIKDYLDITFDGSYNSQVVYVSHIIRIYDVNDNWINDFPSNSPLIPAFDGYGYFEDGANPQNESALMMSNTILYNLDGEDYILPINSELTNYIEFYDSNTLVDYISISQTSIGSKQIEYLESSESISDGYENRVLRDGGVIESLDCIDSEFPNISKFDKAIIYSLLGESTTVNVENISECKHTPHKITFINKFGVLQDLWFFKRSNLSINTKKEEYKANIINSGSYSINSHQNRILKKQGTEKLTLNSGFVNEEYNEVFRQLMLSEKVWINYNSKTLPINISSSSLDYKTSLNDRLINYTVQVDFAFNKINNIK